MMILILSMSILFSLILFCILIFTIIFSNKENINFDFLDSYQRNQKEPSENQLSILRSNYLSKAQKAKNHIIIHQPFEHNSVQVIISDQKIQNQQRSNTIKNKTSNKKQLQELRFASVGLKEMKNINKRIPIQSYFVLENLLNKEKFLSKNLKKKNRMKFASTKLPIIYENISYS